MTDTKECDLFIWSDAGSVLITIPFDEDFWESIKDAMKNFHWETLIPEYFAMRTPRNLTAINL